MTSLEAPLPVPDDDPLAAAASAVVDGVATSEETALVASSPDGDARVAALRAVAAAVGGPRPAQQPAAASRALAAALEAFDREAAAPATDRLIASPQLAGSPVVAPPPGSASSARWLPRLGAVAAVALLLVGIAVLAVAVVSRSSGPATDQAARVAEAPASQPGAGTGPTADAARGVQPSAAPEAASTAAPPRQSTGSAPAAAAPAAAGPPVVDGVPFGDENDVEALAQRASIALRGLPSGKTTRIGAPAPADVERCIATAPKATAEPVGTLLYRTVGTYHGTSALVLGYDHLAGAPRVLLVLDRSDCSLLATTHF